MARSQNITARRSNSEGRQFADEMNRELGRLGASSSRLLWVPAFWDHAAASARFVPFVNDVTEQATLADATGWTEFVVGPGEWRIAGVTIVTESAAGETTLTPYVNREARKPATANLGAGVGAEVSFGLRVSGGDRVALLVSPTAATNSAWLTLALESV